MSTTTEKYYKESGEIGLGAAYILVGGIIASVILGFIYGYATFYIPLIYFNVLITIGFGWALGYVVAKASHAGKTRNEIAVMGFAGLIGLVGSYFGWSAWILAASDEEVLALLPNEILEIMLSVSEDGMWSIFDFTPTGAALYLIWFIEAAIIVVAAVIAAKGTVAAQVFCDTCDKWLPNDVFVSNLEHVKDVQGFIVALDSKNLEPLVVLESTDPTALRKTSVAISHCDSCNKEHYLTVRHEEIVEDDDGKKENQMINLITNLRLTDEEFNQLLAWRDSFKD